MDKLKALLTHIKRARAVDLSGYKTSSLTRRIGARLKTLEIHTYEQYIDYLNTTPTEYERLFDSILINVSSFFRDTHAWQVLQDNVLTPLLTKSPTTQKLRVWSVGCASGEEPYTIAMILAEQLGIERYRQQVKIYATDLDESALQFARHATYPESIREALPNTDFITQYFEHKDQSYSVIRDIRKNVIFGNHNIITDSPISKIDLLICRNLLIYFNVETQKKVLSRFHYALNNQDHLFLGKAETLLTHSKLFRAQNLKSRIFQKIPHVQSAPKMTYRYPTEDNAKITSPSQTLFNKLLENYTIAHLLVDQNGRVIFINRTAKQIFRLTDDQVGQSFHDLKLSYHPAELRSKIEEVMTKKTAITMRDVTWPDKNKNTFYFTIDIQPIYSETNYQGVIIYFYDTTEIKHLKDELEAKNQQLLETKERLQSANEELETTNEELQSTNEELETTNEELQSTNEELETTNEELQAGNSEFEAINLTLQEKVNQLNDYKALQDSMLTSVEIGIIVLDRQLKIQLWNRWSETTWHIQTKNATALSFNTLDLGFSKTTLLEKIHQIHSGQICHYETEVRLPSQNKDEEIEKIYHFILYPLHEKNKKINGVIIVTEDITKYKQAIELSEKAQLELMHVSRISLASEIAVGLTHELSQPTAAALNYINRTQREVNILDTTNTIIANGIKETKQCIQRMSDIIHWLRQFLHSDNKTIICHDINTLIHETASHLKYEFSQHHIQFKISPCSLHTPFTIHKVQIQQVIINILLNAIDALKQKDNNRCITLNTILQTKPPQLTINITDNGPGVASDSIDQIFKPFYTTKKTGMGMGLAICQRMVKTDGGHIDVHSNSSGTEFNIILPIKTIYPIAKTKTRHLTAPID